MRKARMDFRTVAGDESDASGLFDTGHTPYQEYLTALSQVKGGLGAAPQVPRVCRCPSKACRPFAQALPCPARMRSPLRRQLVGLSALRACWRR